MTAAPHAATTIAPSGEPGAVSQRADIVIVCFGFERDRLRRQPWHVVHGIARGLVQQGRRTVVVTDAVEPPWLEAYPVIQVEGLLRRGRPTLELKALIDRLDPSRVLMITGAWHLARLAALDWRPRTMLLMASPRLALKELLSPGLATVFRERQLLALPLLNALLPGWLLRRGFDRSLAGEMIYLSRETQRRYSALGLPYGRRLRPQVVPFAAGLRPIAGASTHVCYLGPPLALRGAYLALEAFEQAVPMGLDCRLLLLLRPDAGGELMGRFMERLEASPVRQLVDVETRMLDETELHERVAGCAAFILPFQAPVSEVPLVILEAGLSGRPVVTLDAPGVTEYAEELGGIVVSEPSQLPHALIHAVRRGHARRPDPSRWQGWTRAVEVLLHDSPRELRDLGLIALCGVDGSGKTFLLRHLQDELQRRRIKHRHVWSRFRNYLSKPLLALARLTGHNRKELVDGVQVGYHDFQGRAWLAWPFLALQVIDNLIDLAWRYRRKDGHMIVGDRCVVDTLVDLAVDTGLDDLVIRRLGPHLVRRLPAPRLIVLIQRHPRLVREDRPDALGDRHFARRRALYERLADMYGLPIIENNGTPQQAVAEILRLVENGGPKLGGEAGDLRILQQ